MESSNRKSHTELEKIYYWTTSIHKWNSLLADDRNKNIIIDSLKYLSDLNLITVHAFVIMPDHLHFLPLLVQEYSTKIKTVTIPNRTCRGLVSDLPTK